MTVAIRPVGIASSDLGPQRLDVPGASSQGARAQTMATGTATNKKEAEANCAEQALQILASYGLLDIPKPSKANKAPAPAGAGAAFGGAAATGPAPALPTYASGGADEFASFKEYIYEMVSLSLSLSVSFFCRIYTPRHAFACPTPAPHDARSRSTPLMRNLW